MVGNAGVIEAEVVLIPRTRSSRQELRWVYLDIGKCRLLAERWTSRSASRPHAVAMATPVVACHSRRTHV